MEKWSKVKLGEIAFITSSKRIFAREYQKEGIPFYRGKEIIEKHNGNSVSTQLYISKKRYDEIKSKYGVPVPGDILLSSVGTLGVPWLVDEEKFYFKDGNLTWLRCNEKCIPKFLYLWFNSAEAKNQIEVMCIGSTQKALTIDALNKFNVSLPPFEVQKKICNVIYSIMDKIRTNDEINRNLLEQCDAIYKDMFEINFDDNWRVGYLSELITIKYGKDHKKLGNGNIPCYGSGGVMRYVEKSIYDHESVLIPRKGTLNNVLYVNTPFWSVDTMFYTVMKLANVAKFVYHFVKEKDLDSMNAGSAVPSMTTDILYAMELRIPSDDVLAKFEDLVSPLYKAISDNRVENKKLAEARDTLLPKLMTGELDVSALEM